ncbi:hypothetical protein [Asticcacaulis sp. YBE204]|uniref:hypothetical protein n=1 Tax=Asticcacaulis sp. YBE204 TaxID=1282363 RepID=UPI0003C3DA83|nr:hypothetical protein [Asticcacaulis sp. YBE204]ESQ79869.1 hypothetical protein AEYBE204_08465 [Asticcacaulis sp. YBE204]
MNGRTPLWQTREASVFGDPWFVFKFGPLGYWVPVKWQGYLVLLVQIGIFILLNQNPLFKHLLAPWDGYLRGGIVGVFLVLIALSLLKTRWR